MTQGDLRGIDANQLVGVMNEWMRRYIDEPERFSREWQSVTVFLADEAAGKVPSYGERCAKFAFKLLDELNAARPA